MLIMMMLVQVKEQDVHNILDWEEKQNISEGVEVPFRPARVILQVGDDWVSCCGDDICSYI